MNSCHFVPNLLRYKCAKNYFNVKRFGKVIAKTKGAVFGTQCIHFNEDKNLVDQPVITMITYIDCNANDDDDDDINNNNKCTLMHNKTTSSTSAASITRAQRSLCDYFR